MKRYDSYKDSGIDWIGEIPSHWEVKKLKYLAKIKSGDPITNSDIKEDGMYEVFGGNGGIGFYKNFNTVGEKIIIGRVGAYCGNVKFINEKKWISDNALILSFFNNDQYPYMRRVLIDENLNLLNTSNAQPLITGSKVLNYIIPLPPLPEQKAIADFLDEKCGQIDTAVSLKEQQIDKLKELRQSVIHKAVTQGLDANTEMKDSGVDWIGEIPKHWEVKRFRNIFSLGKGLTITKENLQEHGIFCVNYGEIHSKFGFQLNPEINVLKCVSVDYLKGNRSSLLNNGDFVFADTSEDLEGSGNFTYLNSDSTTFAGYHTVIARPNKGMFSRFLAYEFDSIKFRNQVRAKVKGVKVYSITQTILKELLVWLPPLSEQEAIVSYLDAKTAEIDKAIDLKQSEITQLKSYKSSLINEVVTGKIRVATT